MVVLWGIIEKRVCCDVPARWTRASPEVVPYQVEILVEVSVSAFLEDDGSLSPLELEMMETTSAELGSRTILRER